MYTAICQKIFSYYSKAFPMAQGIFSPQEVKNLAENYRKKLELMNIPVTKMYLYGSYAKKNPHAGSDIDICIISPAFQDRIDATMTLMKARSDKELVLSPIAFSPKTFMDENPLAWEIKLTGISL